MLGFRRFRELVLSKLEEIIGDTYEFEDYIRSSYALYSSLGWTEDDVVSWIIANITNNDRLEIHSNNLFMYLVNMKDMRDLLMEVPHIIYGEFAAYPRLMVGDEGDLEASIPVTYDLINHQNISRARVCKLALKNTQRMNFTCETAERKIYRMLRRKYGSKKGTRIAREMFPIDQEGSMYILTNDKCIGGAIALVLDDVLEDAARVMGVTQFYIIPSSEHELILIPGNDFGISRLEEVINEVNAGIVERALSQSVYEYDIKKSRLTRIA